MTSEKKSNSGAAFTPERVNYEYNYLIKQINALEERAQYVKDNYPIKYVGNYKTIMYLLEKSKVERSCLECDRNIDILHAKHNKFEQVDLDYHKQTINKLFWYIYTMGC